jgi:hypothetical protein
MINKTKFAIKAFETVSNGRERLVTVGHGMVTQTTIPYFLLYEYVSFGLSLFLFFKRKHYFENRKYIIPLFLKI